MLNSNHNSNYNFSVELKRFAFENSVKSVEAYVRYRKNQIAQSLFRATSFEEVKMLQGQLRELEFLTTFRNFIEKVEKDGDQQRLFPDIID